MAPPHALLVAHWGLEGSAVLSLPTKEYFQSSGWVEERAPHSAPKHVRDPSRATEAGAVDSGDVRSVWSGSEFWADGRSRTTSSSAFTAGIGSYSDSSGVRSISHSAPSQSQEPGREHSRRGSDEDDHDSQGTEVPEDHDDGVVDEVGAQDAFVAGMIYALSRRIAPGPPYTPLFGGEDPDANTGENEKGRWRLDECLRYDHYIFQPMLLILSSIIRFATELSGRKARRRQWDGLAAEMTAAGWFEN